MRRVAKGEKPFGHPLYKQREDGKQISQIHTRGGAGERKGGKN